MNIDKKYFLSFFIGGIDLRKIILFFVLFFVISNLIFAQQTGTITGKVVDKSTGSELIGATVMIKDKSLGGLTKIDGTYRVQNVPVGEYTLSFNYVGYAKIEITGVKVNPGEVTKISVSMESEDVMTEEVVVTAKAVKTTGAALLKERQKADALSDAIGAEEISRGGAGDASDAIKKVTGATTVGGKHVYIRGLGERYSSTQLNGANLPSADPDKKSVHLDLFPAGIIENITTVKTATPDKPGDFTGGTVDIRTKSFPEKFTFGFSTSGSYNSFTTGSEIQTYNGSDTDWLGYDDGYREVPSILKEFEIPSLVEARNDNELSSLLRNQTRAFDLNFAPTTKNAPMNGGFSMNVGNQHELFDNTFGYLATFSYNRKYTNYDNSQIAQHSQASSEATELLTEYRADMLHSNDEVSWGGMLNLAYNITNNNQISFNFMRSQNGESEAVYRDGYEAYYNVNTETRILKYVERAISSYQLSAKHNFPVLAGTKLEWQVSLNENTQYEPNFRTFETEYYIDEINGADTVWKYDLFTADNANAYPSQYFRDLSEDLFSTKVDLEIPFKDIFDIPLTFKTGALYNEKNRDFVESRFIYREDEAVASLVDYDEIRDPDIFMDMYADTITKYKGKDYYGLYIEDRTQPAGSYTGDLEIFAGYGMIDWYVLPNFRFVGGIRYETTKMSAQSADTSKQSGQIDEQDLLPSVNLTYQLSNNMNLRLAYGRTIARPTFREIAPYNSFMPIEYYTYLGNDSLDRTLVDNFDLRWEWFTNPGEIVSVGGFYKSFENPIVLTIVNANFEHQPWNVDKGFLYGAEIEYRKRLGFLGEFFEDFQFGANLTLVKSEIELTDFLFNLNKQLDSNATNARDFQGQSPYVVNLDLSYTNYDTGTDANFYFNVFGKRLSKIGFAAPDYYEFPRPELNFSASQKFLKNFKAKFSVKNILDSKVYNASTFRGKEYISYEYYLGRTFSFSLSYAIN